MHRSVLTATGLSKTYAGSAVPALDGLDLSAAEGEVVGLLGPNGAGKTTAISILCTLLRPDRGSVNICGRNAVRDPAGVRGCIGLAPQEIALYTRLSLRENLAYFGGLAGLGSAECRRRVEDCLELLELAPHASKLAGRCSGGIRRRANLAAALVHEPRLLVLDEPTSGVDAASRHRILSTIDGLRLGGTTVIYTSHYMEEITRVCSRVTIVDEGRAVAEGTPAGLVAAHPGCRDLEEVFLHLTGRTLRE